MKYLQGSAVEGLVWEDGGQSIAGTLLYWGDSIMFYLATSISLFVHPFLPPPIVWPRGFTP